MKKSKIKVFLCLFVLYSLAFSLNGCGNKQEDVVHEQIFAMDTVMDITIYGENRDAAVAKVKARINELNHIFSVNDKTSDVSKINENAGRPVKVSEDTHRIIQEAIEMSKSTDGLFDISVFPVVKAWGFTTSEYRVPDEAERKNLLEKVNYKNIKCYSNNRVQIGEGMSIDLGGIAKGYTSDQILILLKELNVKSAIVSLGGNVQTLGEKKSGEEFKVGISNPLLKNELLGTLTAQDECVITSGSHERFFEKDGKRYHHIMDVRTGAPAASDLASVTVVGKNGTKADALSTALFVMGSKKAIAYQKKYNDFEMVYMTESGDTFMTKGLMNRLKLQT